MLEILWINCKVTLILTCCANCVILSGATSNQATASTIADTKLYDLVATLSIQDYPKLLQQFISGLKRTME